jgi:hypothetical protein
VLQLSYAPPPEPAPVQLPVLHLSAEPALTPATDSTSTMTSP